MSEEKKSYEDLAGCLLLIVAFPVIVVIRGVVLSNLWYYFVEPLGVQSVSVPHAFGLALFYSVINYRHSGKEKSFKEKCDQLVESIGGPLFVLLIGWLVYWYWM